MISAETRHDEELGHFPREGTREGGGGTGGIVRASLPFVAGVYMNKYSFVLDSDAMMSSHRRSKKGFEKVGN